MFKITIIGRLGRDAKVYETANGVKFVAMSVAVNTKNMGNDETYWVDVRSFNQNHIKLAKYLTKGKIIHAGGDFNTGTAIDKTKKVIVTHSLLADFIGFINLGGSFNKTDQQETDNQDSIKEKTDIPSQVSTHITDEDTIVMNSVKPSEEKEPVMVGVGTSEDDDNELPF